MKITPLICVGIVLLGLASPAVASDFSGAMSILFGVPLMGVAAVVYGVLAFFPRLHPTAYTIAVIAFALLMVCGLWMTADAMAALRRYPNFAYLYLALFGLVIVCFAVMAGRHRAYRARLGAQEVKE